MPQSRWRLIVNGKSAESAPLREAVQQRRKLGIELGVRVTWEHGDAARYVAEALTDAVDVVIAAGGDGTLNEVAAALAADVRDAEILPSLGIVPAGTANDFATSCGVPDTPDEALALIADVTAVPIDAGRIGTRWFINVATGGFGTEVTQDTSPELKRLLGSAAYILTGLRHFTSVRSAFACFRGDGFQWKGEFLVLAIGNGRQAGGGQVLCPQAQIDDGLLDIAILPNPPPGEMAGAVTSLLSQGRAAIDDAMVRGRVSWLEIAPAPESPLNLNLDGEPLLAEHIRIDAVPGRLRVHLPLDCALLARRI